MKDPDISYIYETHVRPLCSSPDRRTENSIKATALKDAKLRSAAPLSARNSDSNLSALVSHGRAKNACLCTSTAS